MKKKVLSVTLPYLSFDDISNPVDFTGSSFALVLSKHPVYRNKTADHDLFSRQQAQFRIVAEGCSYEWPTILYLIHIFLVEIHLFIVVMIPDISC